MSNPDNDYPLSNFDIEKLVSEFAPHANIKVDTKIKSDTPLNNIFGDQGHTILFHDWGSKVGHWYCMIRDRNNEVFFFDSLGESPDYYNKEIIPFLKNNGIKNLIINKKKFQKNTTDTCGRWATLLAGLNKTSLDVPQMYKYLDHLKKDYGNYDNAVLNLVK